MSISQSARTATINMVRHRGATVVAIATVAFLLSALTIFVMIASGLGNAASGLEQKANLIADLNNRTGHARVHELERRIKHRWPAAQIQFLTKGEAKAQFFREFSGNTAMLSALQGNPLPASLQVRDPDGDALTSIARMLRHSGRVNHIIFNPNLTNKLLAITAIVTIGGLAVVLGLGFLALLIVVNTTHLTVEARREEIQVMRLIGATHSFVRNPLIVEGVLLGLCGAFIAVVIGIGLFVPLVKGVLGTSSSLDALLPIDSQASFLAGVVLLIAVVGSGIGALGSYVSVRRFAHI